MPARNVRIVEVMGSSPICSTIRNPFNCEAVERISLSFAETRTGDPACGSGERSRIHRGAFEKPERILTSRPLPRDEIEKEYSFFKGEFGSLFHSQSAVILLVKWYLI